MIASFDYTPSEESSWVLYARCRDRLTAPDMFPSGQDEEAVDVAKRFCLECPVIAECLTEALTRGEKHGIWGGLDMRERTSVKRNRSRVTLKDRKVARDAQPEEGAA